MTFSFTYKIYIPLWGVIPSFIFIWSRNNVLFTQPSICSVNNEHLLRQGWLLNENLVNNTHSSYLPKNFIVKSIVLKQQQCALIQIYLINIDWLIVNW